MKKILSIIIISLIICCGLGVQGSKIQNKNQNIQFSPGDYFRFINVNGRIRSYRIHIPPSYDNIYPMPVVFSLHGDGFPAVNSFTQKYYYSSDKIGRRRVGKECRSRWSPYH